MSLISVMIKTHRSDFRLEELPTTNKIKMMKNFNRWITDQCITMKKIEEFTNNIENVGHMIDGKYLIFKTSGSTGNPATILYDKHNHPVGYGIRSDKVLITNLSNYIQPFIRYEVTDRIIVHNEKCKCGKETCWLEIEGRTDDILEFENGIFIAPMSFYKILEEIKEIDRFQLVQKSKEKLEQKLTAVTDELFIKTKQEADAGARIVFWSELNGAVLKQDEPALLEKASTIAKEEGIYLIVSLLVKTPYESLKENKTVAFNPQGELISEYFKHGRSIGELCQKGDGVLKSFDTEYGRIAPFICSDMAFVSKIRQAGRDHVDILIVPASDWKEMTLLAAKTAIVRGVENGCNIIRHTNNGMSIVSDFRGSVLAQTDYFQSDTKTLSAQVITKGRFTLYSYIGNLFVYLCSIYLLGSFIIPKVKRLL